MIKKAIIGTGLVVVVALLLFGTHVVSYVRTSVACVGEALHDSVPIDFQIKRARGLIEDLDPDIRDNLQAIAKGQVDVERRARGLAEAEASLAKAKADIDRLTEDLKSDEVAFKYARQQTFTRDQVQADLRNRFECYKTSKATLEAKQGIYQARVQRLEADRKRLNGILAEKQELQVKVENLEARLQMIAAAQTISDSNFDDSRLARAKELIDDLDAQLEVEQRMVDIGGQYRGQIPLDDPNQGDILTEVTQYFEGPQLEVLASD
ncbi:MAG: hypothetical protein ACYTG0_05580 [Planctomycetota bacterium]|jgi:chromosome segregation ATPase